VSSVELSPGVVIDPDRREAYVMSPEGGIVAVDLAQGTEIWRSQEAAKPLALAGDLLIGQAETRGPADDLAIVALDRSKKGAPVTRSSVPMPPGVQPMLAQSMNRTFVARAQPGPNEASISWEFVQRPLRGIAPDPLEVLPGEAPPAVFAAPAPGPTTAGPGDVVEPGAEIVTRGTFRMDLGNGSVTPMSVETGAVPTLAPAGPGFAAAADVASDEYLPGVPEPQFLSADGRHVMHSERLADDTVWDKYRWTLYDRNGQRVGELRTHMSYAPFVVSGSQVIHQTSPYALRSGSDFVEEPLQIRAIDLSTGKLVWSQPVRDTTDREPPPP
jgi:hypothetical protein